MIEDDRLADVLQITDKMIDAGAAVHAEWEFGGPRHPAVREIVKQIFEAMIAVGDATLKASTSG
jgi:hypothetical protein